MTEQKKEFDHGDRAWTRDGVKVFVEAETTAGQYLVAPLLDIGAYDPDYGPPNEESGPYVLVDELYAEAPRQFVDAEIAKAKQELETLRDQLGDVRSEIRNATAERSRLLDKLKQVPALQHIEQMLEGKMRFVVVERYGEPKAMTIEEAQKTDGWRSERRMVTLTTAKEGAAWAINTYHDGSGSDQKIWFFETEEEAKAKVIDNLSLKLDEAYQRFRTEMNGRAYASAIVSYAASLVAAGGTLPDDISTAMKAIRREAAQQAIANNQKHAETYLKGIEAARAELAALDAEQAS